MDFPKPDDFENQNNQPMNDEEYDRIQKRIKLLTLLEQLGHESLKTTNLFMMKYRETDDISWLEKATNLCLLFKEQKAITIEEYKALGGTNYPKGE